jgi:oxaloacetate decarboxylase (Na+ extruding) subunit gamma
MTELISSGVELMFIGMGIVYLFLAMLVVAINVMSAMVLRFFPEPRSTTSAVASVASGVADKQTIAAISAAIHQFRSKHKAHE